MPKQNISSIVRGAGLAAGIWVALDKAVRKRGGTDEDLHRLATNEGEKLIGKIADLIVEAGRKKQLLLELVGTVTIPAISQRFVAAEKFVVADSPVRIAWLGSNFQEWFLGKTENPIPETTLRYAKLTRAELDGPIMTELGDAKESTLSHIYGLMARQANGEEGVLLTNSWANIFYVRDVNGVLRAVGASCDGGGWYVSADSVGRPSGWSVGSRVFFRNS